VYVSWDDGVNWQSLGLNLPVAQVSDLQVEERDLVIATHGRSFWVLYDIAPLRQMGPEVADAAVHLFQPLDARRGLDWGVQVVYHLAEEVDSLTLEFLDADGTVIRTFTAGAGDDGEADDEEDGGFFGRRDPKPAREAGSHTFTWDLRYPGYTEFEGRIFWAAGNRGPVAVPGRYQVRLSTGDVVLTEDFAVTVDPRLADQVTQEQLQERFDLALRIRDRVSEANEAVIRIRELKAAIADRLEETDARRIERQAQRVTERLSAVEEEIYQVRNQSSQDPLNFPIKLNNKLAALIGVVESAEAPPTDQSYEVFEHLSGRLQEQLDRLDETVETELARLNEMLTEAGLEAVEVESEG
jgi:hypothetical protein